MNAPTEKERALANLRHLYTQMVFGTVSNTDQAKRIAEGLLSPAIAKLEQAARRAPAVPVPQFSRIAQKKLDYLLEAGEAITGYAIENKDGRRGAIDCHGFVYWWQDAAAPQSPGVEVANKCAQCKKAYSASKNSVGCLKCAPGKAIDEAEFIKPITSTPVRKSASAPTPNNPQEIAPVVLPEYGIDTANHAGIRVRGYTEQQVRELLANHGIQEQST